MLDKLQKRVCRTTGPSLATSFEPLVHRRNVDIDVRLDWFHFFLFKAGPLVLIGCMIFLSPFLDAIRMILPIE